MHSYTRYDTLQFILYIHLFVKKLRAFKSKEALRTIKASHDDFKCHDPITCVNIVHHKAVIVSLLMLSSHRLFLKVLISSLFRVTYFSRL